MLVSFGIAFLAFEFVPNQYGELRKVVILLCFVTMTAAIMKFQLKMNRKE